MVGQQARQACLAALGGFATDAGVDDGMISLRRYDFVVQLVWQPRTPGGPEPVMPDSGQSEETDN